MGEKVPVIKCVHCGKVFEWTAKFWKSQFFVWTEKGREKAKEKHEKICSAEMRRQANQRWEQDYIDTIMMARPGKKWDYAGRRRLASSRVMKRLEDAEINATER